MAPDIYGSKSLAICWRDTAHGLCRIKIPAHSTPQLTFATCNLSGKDFPPKLLNLYTELLRPRMIEEKMLVLLRQGRISKWFSGIGQEAIAVGATLALDSDE